MWRLITEVCLGDGNLGDDMAVWQSDCGLTMVLLDTGRDAIVGLSETWYGPDELGGISGETPDVWSGAA